MPLIVFKRLIVTIKMHKERERLQINLNFLKWGMPGRQCHGRMKSLRPSIHLIVFLLPMLPYLI